jgi:3-oxoacyl-ACP reductase-like protein
MPAEKRARLEAIRRANLAKRGGAAAAPTPEPAAPAEAAAEPVEAAPAPAPAAPAAVAASADGLPFSRENLLGGVPANTAMSEDKLERLKAIRAGNLAKRE